MNQVMRVPKVPKTNGLNPRQRKNRIRLRRMERRVAGWFIGSIAALVALWNAARWLFLTLVES
jgi:hypothetical protein